MAKIIIAGDAVVVKSTVTPEDILAVKKHKPTALCLTDEDTGEALFAVDVAERGNGNINEYGASFAKVSRDDNKCATITMIPAATGSLKDWIADNIGTAVANLNKIEATIPAVLSEIKANRDAVVNNISTAD